MNLLQFLLFIHGQISDTPAMRVMGLDIGEKTVGVAHSDPLGITAQPIETIHYQSPSEAFKRIFTLIREKKTKKIIAGIPLTMNGEQGPQAQKVKLFVQHLQQFLTKRGEICEVEFWDERLSTVGAERVLLDAKLSRAKRKKVIDKMAASYILQGYLESRRDPANIS